MLVVAVRAGRTQVYPSTEGEWESAIVKPPVTGRARVTSEGIEGDQQADRKNHGGVDKAVLAYCRDHYDAWRMDLARPDFGPGVLGENLEISGQSEADVCIGDSYRVGDVVFQVSQPRQPCWKPAELHGSRQLTNWMGTRGRTGWYLRVLQPGVIEAGSAGELLVRPHPDWTVKRANEMIYNKAEGAASAAELAELPELSAAWQHMLRRQG